jgi:hypothetical protein
MNNATPAGPPGEGRRTVVLVIPLLALIVALVAAYGMNCSAADAGGFCPRLPDFSLPSAPVAPAAVPASLPTPQAIVAPAPLAPLPPLPAPPQKTEVANLFASVQDHVRASLVAMLQPDAEAVGMVATVRARRTVSPELVKDTIEVLKRIGFEARLEGGELDVAGAPGGQPGEIYVRSAPQRRRLAILIVDGMARVSAPVIKGEARIGVRPLAGAVPQSNGRYDPIVVDMF